MTETPAPAAAVLIVREALAVRGYLTTIDSVEAPRVAAALARRGWLHDPAEVERLRVFVDAAHGIICNAHQKRVDDVTTEDGASPGWAEAARRWIDAYPFGVLAAAPEREAGTAPRVCSKCGTAGCLEDAESGWYDEPESGTAS